MRLIFAGTPVFAELALRALVGAGHDVALVLTRPDRPAQRGQKLSASPVKQWAQARGIEVWQPRTLREPEAWARLRAVGADAMVVAAYGMLLPPEALAIPRLGCLNIHASLLPRWRGAAPIQRAVQAGDTETGITIMQMDAGLDTGPMRLVRTIPIGVDEPAGSVHDRLAAAGAEAIVEALARLEAGDLPLHAQPAVGVTHAAKITRADSAIDWSAPPRAIVDRLRALDPAPGGAAELARLPGTVLKLWRARVADDAPPGVQAAATPAGPGGEAAPDAGVQATGHRAVAPPGTVLSVGAGGILVACGTGPAGGASGAVALLELQRPGGRRMPAREFLAGFPLFPGDLLQTPAAPPEGPRKA
jgi:methionyl-tRNA formyltransferase